MKIQSLTLWIFAFLIQLSITAFAAATKEIALPITVTLPALNVRSSPGSSNSSNLVKNCRLKKNDTVFASDFAFKDGIPWCKVHVSNEENCPQDQDVWIAGDSDYVRITDMPIDPVYTVPQSTTETQSKFCYTCNLQSENNMQKNLDEMGFESRAIRIGPPIYMTNDCLGEDCNCRGISSDWGVRKHPEGGQRSHHRGVDIAAPRKTPIYAAADGVVTMAAWSGGYGNRVVIQHFDQTKSADEQVEKENDDIIGTKEGQSVLVRACGIERVKKVEKLSTTYNHMLSIAKDIAPGKVVKKGDVIGYLNSKGLSTGDHLHFEVEPVGLGCQQFEFGDTCDAKYFHGFPPRAPPGVLGYKCN